MKHSVENCDHERILNTTANLAVNIDRSIISAGELGDTELQRKFMNIDNDMSKLKDIFAAKRACTKK
jgi:hypothetical protein